MRLPDRVRDGDRVLRAGEGGDLSTRSLRHGQDDRLVVDEPIRHADRAVRIEAGQDDRPDAALVLRRRHGLEGVQVDRRASREDRGAAQDRRTLDSQPEQERF